MPRRANSAETVAARQPNRLANRDWMKKIQPSTAALLQRGNELGFNFVSGQRHGKGLYACPNGYIYEGSYTMGQVNGHAQRVTEGVFVK